MNNDSGMTFSISLHRVVSTLHTESVYVYSLAQVYRTNLFLVGVALLEEGQLSCKLDRSAKNTRSL